MRYLIPCLAGLLLATLGSVFAADKDKDEAAKKDLKKIAGTWMMTSREVDGQKTPEKSLEGIELKAEADGTRTVSKDGTVLVKVKWSNVDPTKEPKTLDNEVVLGGKREKTLGIYKLEDDELVLCLAAAGKERPTKFSAAEGSGCTLISYKRTKTK